MLSIVTQTDGFSQKVHQAAEEFVQSTLQDPRLLQAQDVMRQGEVERTLIADLTEAREKLESAKSILSNNVDELQKQVEGKREELSQVLNEIDEKTAKHAQITDLIGKAKEEKELVEAKTSEHLQKQIDIDQQITLLTDQSTRLDQEISEKQAQKETLDATVEDVKRSQAITEQNHADIIDGYVKKEQELTTQNQELSQENDQLQASKREMTEEVGTLKTAIDDLNAQVSAKQAELAQVTQSIEELKAATDQEIAEKKAELEKEQLYTAQASQLAESKSNVMAIAKEKLKDIITSLAEKAEGDDKQNLKNTLSLVDKI